MSLKDIGIILSIVVIVFLSEMIFGDSKASKEMLSGLGKAIDDFRRWINKL